MSRHTRLHYIFEVFILPTKRQLNIPTMENVSLDLANSAYMVVAWYDIFMYIEILSYFLRNENIKINLFSSLKLIIIVSSIALLISYIKRFQYNALCSFSNRNLYLYVELNWQMSCQVKESCATIVKRIK